MYIRDIKKIMKPYIEDLGVIEAVRKYFPFNSNTYYAMERGRYNWDKMRIDSKKKLVEWIESEKAGLR